MGDTLGIKIGMIFLFFSVSLGGSFLPIFSPKWMIEGSTIPVLCSLSAGTMLGVALAHLLPESNEALEGAVSDYSLAFALCGLGVILVLAVEQITIALIAKWKAGNKFRSSKDLLQPIGCVISPEGSNQSGDEDVECRNPDHDHHKHDDHNHNHGTDVLDELMKANSFKDLVSLYALELSVAIHSIILGIEFGLEKDYKTLVALSIALSFHQTIEGVAMGAAITNFKDVMTQGKIITFMVIFASTISAGVIIGLATSFSQEADNAETIQGVFAALASGTLMYVALTEQVATYFNKPELEDQLGIKLLMILAFIFGFGAMALLAAWE